MERRPCRETTPKAIGVLGAAVQNLRIDQAGKGEARTRAVKVNWIRQDPVGIT